MVYLYSFFSQSGLRWQEARVSIGEYTNIHPDYVPEQIGNAGQVEEVEQDDVGDIHPNSLPGQIGNVDQVEEDEEDDDGDVNPCSVPGQISNVGQVEEDEEDDDDDSTNSDNGSSSADSNRSSTHSENTVYYPEASVSLLSDSGDTVYYGGAVVWWRHQICAGNSPVTGEFPSQRPVTRSLDVFFHLRLTKRFNKQSARRQFETPSRSLWRHCNGIGPVSWLFADGEVRLWS